MIVFPGQQSDEKILLVLHRHWWPFVKDIGRVILLAVIPAGILWAGLAMSGTTLDRASFGFAIVVMLMTLYFVFLAVLLYGFWLDYYLDVFIVTNKRVVDVEQNGLLSRTIAEQPLYRIQDVTSEINGLFAHLLHYGNVYIQTAGQKERFFFEQIPNPEVVVRMILSMTDTLVRSHPDQKMTQERTGKP